MRAEPFLLKYGILLGAVVGSTTSPRTRRAQAANGQACSSDGDCLSSACGLDSISPNAQEICCATGATVLFDFEPFVPLPDTPEDNDEDEDFFEEEEGSEAPTPTPWYITYDYIVNRKVCTGQGVGGACAYANELCTSGVCANDECQAGKLADGEGCSDDNDCLSGACGGETASETSYRICCSSGSAVFNICTGQPAGAECGRKNSLCASGNCDGGICSGEPLTSGPGCTDDNDCGTGVCVKGECLTRRVPRGGECDSDGDCLNGKCGLESASAGAVAVCCLSNGHAFAGAAFGNVCTGLSDGAPCGSANEVCSGGYCIAGFCRSSAPITSAPVSTLVPTDAPVLLNVAVTVPPTSTPLDLSTLTGTPTITSTIRVEPTMQPVVPTIAPTAEPTYVLWGPKTILDLSIELIGATDLSPFSIAIFEEEFENHGDDTFDGTGTAKFRAVSDYNTKITFVSQSPSPSRMLKNEAGRRLEQGVVVTFNQEISYRADSSIVDLSFVIEAPFKNKNRRNLFRDRLVNSGDRAFRNLPEDNAVSNIILPGTGPDPTLAPTKATEPSSSGYRFGTAIYSATIGCFAATVLLI